MRVTGSSAPRTGVAMTIDVALILWTIYSLTQHFRNADADSISLLQPLWLYRIRKHDKTTLTDTILCLSVYVLGHGLPSIQNVVQQLVPAWIHQERSMELQIFSMVFVMAVFAGAIAYRGEDPREQNDGSFGYIVIPLLLVSLATSLWLNDVRTIQDLLLLIFPQWIIQERPVEFKSFAMIVLLATLAGIVVWRGEEKPHVKFAETTHSWEKEDYLLPPMLIPGRTTHTRFFPEKHSFDYSYLSVGVPVGWIGCAGSALSCDVNHLPSSKRRRGWFDVSAKDHLSRNGHNCLDHKLGHYLRQQVC